MGKPKSKVIIMAGQRHPEDGLRGLRRAPGCEEGRNHDRCALGRGRSRGHSLNWHTTMRRTGSLQPLEGHWWVGLRATK